jgi:hypothetical protein
LRFAVAVFAFVRAHAGSAEGFFLPTSAGSKVTIIARAFRAAFAHLSVWEGFDADVHHIDESASKACGTLIIGARFAFFGQWLAFAKHEALWNSAERAGGSTFVGLGAFATVSHEANEDRCATGALKWSVLGENRALIFDLIQATLRGGSIEFKATGIDRTLKPGNDIRVELTLDQGLAFRGCFGHGREVLEECYLLHWRAAGKCEVAKKSRH